MKESFQVILVKVGASRISCNIPEQLVRAIVNFELVENFFLPCCEFKSVLIFVFYSLFTFKFFELFKAVFIFSLAVTHTFLPVPLVL